MSKNTKPSFRKLFLRTFEEVAAVDIEDRFKYYLDRALLKQRTTFKRGGEPLVSQTEIEKAGIMCRPFWEDDKQGEELDSEGRAFRRYLEQHPDFDVCVRAGVLPKLVAVQNKLPKNTRLVIKAAYRPVSVQREIFAEELQNIRDKHADWTEAQARKYALEFVTDPDIYLPPHASGGTLDLHLWDEINKRYIDVGSPINAVDDSSWADNTDKLSDEQVKNRTMLREAMLSEGFAPLASEWWHFSYGDQRWAVYYEKQAALYGAVTEREKSK